ncbi:MAG: L-2-hydroxyglutarate oxidase [Spirochaetes bacterium]|nr:L-2-hydroxyglutarate oxidase [Spirochaetota bacterium]
MGKRIVVVGGGLVGLGTALALRKRFPGAALTVIEKEGGFGRHQSTHNSGVLHAGLYYKPGSVKARLAVEGIRLMTAFCQKHGVAHEICGKVVVAATEEERPRLATLWERGQANGLLGMRRLEQGELREREPRAAGVAAILVPQEGIVDYAGVVAAMAKELAAGGAELRLGWALRRAKRVSGEWILETSGGDLKADFAVACAGLHSDAVARAFGARPDCRIIPFRGEYFALKAEKAGWVKHLIYPVPDPQYPFLGVHFTRLIHGGIEAGPNAVLALAREGYRKRDVRVGDLAGTLLFPGMRRFLWRHKGMAWDELQRSFRRALFAQSLARLVPGITASDLDHGGSGVRAQAMLRDGSLVQDFQWLDQDGALHVLNAPSPAATASLAIGEEIAARVSERFAA